jgi:hypothetical protein
MICFSLQDERVNADPILTKPLLMKESQRWDNPILGFLHSAAAGRRLEKGHLNRAGTQ